VKTEEKKAPPWKKKKGPRPICEFFRKGRCYKGNACTYFHEVSSANGDRNTHPSNAKKSSAPATKPFAKGPAMKHSSQSSSNPLKDFCIGLQKNLKSKSSSGFIPTDRNLQQWRVCFESAGSPSSDLANYRSTFLQTYLKLPDEERFAPKAENVLQVVETYLKQPNADLQIVLNIFQQRLHRESILQTIDDKTKIEDELNRLETSVRSLFKTANGDKLDRLVELLSQVREYKVKISALVIKSAKADVSLNDGETSNPIFGWLKCSNVAWLASGCIIGGPTLKKSYTSVDDYVLSVQSVWTMLTFYWGTAALWPRCRCRTPQEMSCSKPLLAQTRKGVPCSMKIRTASGKMTPCSGVANWKCGFRGHDSICDRCLEKQQELILGPSGSREASTDIYDGEVTRTHLQMDSAVLSISKLASRKPPAVPVRWRTTYRLQPATLVGVIAMHASNVSLQKSMTIYWGEVSNSYGELQECQLRERGQMTIRILSRADCGDLPAHIDLPFAVGSKVVVIDLRVFVPEVMSVLSTLVHSSFSSGLERLPFIRPVLASGGGNVTFLEEATSILTKHDPSKLDRIDDLMATHKGREHLLIHKLKRKYVTDDVSNTLSLSAAVMAREGLNEMIQLAVESSQILCIKQLPPLEKDEIIRRICSIPPVRSLDKTQGMAFALGLLKTLHCTQGPPGTGKSYVGVCLILALIVVRQVVKRKNNYVGPIVALSYKNHALDEFLVDVLENDASLRQHGALIRLGKPENEKLENFTERRSTDEVTARKELERRVVVLKNAKVHVQKWMIESDITTCDSLDSVYDCLRVLSSVVEASEASDAAELTTGAECFESVKDLFKTAQDTSIDDVVQMLMQDSDHWHPSVEECGFQLGNLSRQQTLLKCWLAGLTPPPRCLAVQQTGHQCTNTAMQGSSFCKESHTCKFPQCYGQRHPDFKYCDFHCCGAMVKGGCKEGKLEGSRYCSEHCCPACIEKEKVGLFACESHCCSELHCDKLQLMPFSFCLSHCCRVCVEHDAVSKDSRVSSRWSFCELHKCRVPNCENLKCNDATCDLHSCRHCGVPIESGDFCADHCCRFEEEFCPSLRAVTVNGVESHFCQLHTCDFCVELGCPLTECTYAPSYTCLDHPRCQEINADGGECFQLASAEGLYCEFHVRFQAEASTTCAGTTKKRKQCRSAKPKEERGVWYCADHKAQAPPMKPPSDDTRAEQMHVLYAKPNNSTDKQIHITAQLQPNALKLMTCRVPGCGCREGNLRTSELLDATWECKLHSAISLSSRVIETLRKKVASVEVADEKVNTKTAKASEPPCAPSTAGKGKLSSSCI
jgi:hypothetical protein